MRSDRWSTISEIKNTLVRGEEDGTGGPILYHGNGQNWIHDREGHMIFLGVSGSGKSRRGTIPMIKSFIKAGESFVAVDPKGEIHELTAAEAEGKYQIHVIDFRHIFESERWNPLAAPYGLYMSGNPMDRQLAIEMIDELAHALYREEPNADPFWADTARTLFIGLVNALMEVAEPEQINIGSIYEMVMSGDEKFGAGSTYLSEFVEMLPENSSARLQIYSYIKAPRDTHDSIRSVFLEGISLFARSEGLMSMVGFDDLCINELSGSVPTAIYVIIPDERPIFDDLAGVLCSQIMSHYVRMAQDDFRGKLPRRLNVCLEELGNIGGAISSLDHLMSAGRSRNIRCQLVLQSLSQLDQIYGSNKATTIKSNADVLVAYRTNHWETLEELSRKCGEREINHGNFISTERLITPSQLASMRTGQALVMVSGITKFITWLPDFTEMFDCSDWKEPKHVVRADHEKPPVFDLKNMVKEYKRRKVHEEWSSDSSSYPDFSALMDKNSRDSGVPHIPTFEEFMAEREAKQEAERKEAERREAERKKAERREAERREAERREAERKEAERRAKEQNELVEKEAAKETNSETNVKEKYTVRVKSIGKSKEDLMALLMMHCKLPVERAASVVKRLPFRIDFPKEENRMAFIEHANMLGIETEIL